MANRADNSKAWPNAFNIFKPARVLQYEKLKIHISIKSLIKIL